MKSINLYFVQKLILILLKIIFIIISITFSLKPDNTILQQNEGLKSNTESQLYVFPQAQF